jgi:hypothetical protein
MDAIGQYEPSVRGTFWQLLLTVPPEGGVFIFPHVYLGVSPITAALTSALFAVMMHYPAYPMSACIPKGLSHFVVALCLFPCGIWTVIAGHLALDLLIVFIVRDVE